MSAKYPSSPAECRTVISVSSVISTPPASRLRARCMNCTYSSSRTLFFQAVPHQVPGFTDICPRCGSDNVEVSDAKLVEQTQPNGTQHAESIARATATH